MSLRRVVAQPAAAEETPPLTYAKPAATMEDIAAATSTIAAGKRKRDDDDDEPQPSPPLSTPAPVAIDEENWDPFGECEPAPKARVEPAAPRVSALLAKPRTSALDLVLGPTAICSPPLTTSSSSHSMAMTTPARKRVKSTASSSSKSNAKSDSPALSRSPSSNADDDIGSDVGSPAAASSGSASTPSPTVHQALVDDFLNVDRAHQATRDPFAVKRRKVEQGRACCPTCNDLLTHTTWEDHKAVCKSTPPPRTFISAEAAAKLPPATMVVQYLSTRGARWPKSMLLRFTHDQFVASKGADRRRLVHALKWLRSMLHNNNGRIDDDARTTGPGAADDEHDEEMKTSDEEDPELAVQPGHELWLFVVPSSNAYVLACACVIDLNVDASRVSRREGSLEVRKPQQKQLTLAAMFAPKKPAAAASPASSHANGAEAQSSIPIFGVDKIALHSSYRFSVLAKKGSSSAGGSASAAPCSLAVHLLTSILASRFAHAASLAYARVAFSSPTLAGEKLAVRFTGCQRFLTYALDA